MDVSRFRSRLASERAANSSPYSRLSPANIEFQPNPRLVRGLPGAWFTPGDSCQKNVPLLDKCQGCDQGLSKAAEPVSTVELVCGIIERVIAPCHRCSRPDDHFHSVSLPDVGGASYLRRLMHFGLQDKEHLAGPVVLYAFVLIDRLLNKQGGAGFSLCNMNVHRVLLVAVLIAAKILDDQPYDNERWARTGGVPLAHLNALEVHTMMMLDHELHVSSAAIDAMRFRLVIMDQAN
jgi:hypothetical protein